MKKTAKKADKISAALKKIVGNTSSEFCLLKNDKVVMPVKPNFYVNSILPEKCTCFKSAKTPLLLNFKVTPTNINNQLQQVESIGLGHSITKPLDSFS